MHVDMNLAGWSLLGGAYQLKSRSSRIIHLWSAKLSDFIESTAELTGWLSPDERTRAECFVHMLDRDRFVARRVILRLILAVYLELRPPNLRFQTGAWGKPALLPHCAQEPLYFNLSHSQGIALYAVSRSDPVGVDLEKIVPLSELEAMKRQCLSEREQREFGSLSASQQLEAFYRKWTSKEAVLKATGEGISEGMSEVEIWSSPNGSPTCGSIRRESGPEPWALWHVDPVAGYFGAVAGKSASTRLCCGWLEPDMLAFPF